MSNIFNKKNNNFAVKFDFCFVKKKKNKFFLSKNILYNKIVLFVECKNKKYKQINYNKLYYKLNNYS